MKSDNAETIKRATDELQRASHSLADTLYKSQGSAGGDSRQDGQGRTTEPKDGEVVDAEFAETK